MTIKMVALAAAMVAVSATAFAQATPRQSPDAIAAQQGLTEVPGACDAGMALVDARYYIAKIYAPQGWTVTNVAPIHNSRGPSSASNNGGRAFLVCSFYVFGHRGQKLMTRRGYATFLGAGGGALDWFLWNPTGRGELKHPKFGNAYAISLTYPTPDDNASEGGDAAAQLQSEINAMRAARRAAANAAWYQLQQPDPNGRGSTLSPPPACAYTGGCR